MVTSSGASARLENLRNYFEVQISMISLPSPASVAVRGRSNARTVRPRLVAKPNGMANLEM